MFAGRIADTGRDPIPLMKDCLAELKGHPKAELLWASPRELLNIFQADEMGCHIITAPNDVLKKLPALGTKTGAELSRGAVQAFREDAIAAGLTLKTPAARAAE